MSSYLSFYLVPKKTKTKYIDGDAIEVELNQEPLLLFSFCRVSKVYERYYQTLHPAYCGNGEQYTELTEEKAKEVVREFIEEEINPNKERLKILYKILKEGGYNDDISEQIYELEEYIRADELDLTELKHLSSFVSDIYLNYGDFEKILINID